MSVKERVDPPQKKKSERRGNAFIQGHMQRNDQAKQSKALTSTIVVTVITVASSSTATASGIIVAIISAPTSTGLIVAIISATSVVTVSAAAVSATTVVIPVASSVPAAVPAAAEAVLASALGLGLRDAEGTAVDLHAVDVGHGLASILGSHGHEGEATALAGVALGGDEAVGDGPVLLEHGADLVLGGLVREVANVELDVRGAGGVEAGAVAAGTGLVDADGTSVEVGVVHLGDGRLGGGAVGKGNESES